MGENPNKQARFINHLEDAGVAAETHEQGMVAEVARNQVPHLVEIERGPARALQRLLKEEDLLDDPAHGIELFGSHMDTSSLADCVDFKGLAQFVKLHDILPFQLDNHRSAVRGLFEQSLGDELAEGLPHRRAAAAEVSGQGHFREGAAGLQFARGDLRQNVPIRFLSMHGARRCWSTIR